MGVCVVAVVSAAAPPPLVKVCGEQKKHTDGS
jgi:hypothetical protein